MIGERTLANNSIDVPNKIVGAFSELKCNFSGRSIVPNLAIFVWDVIHGDDNGAVANIFPLAPDWIIEIIYSVKQQ